MTYSLNKKWLAVNVRNAFKRKIIVKWCYQRYRQYVLWSQRCVLGVIFRSKPCEFYNIVRYCKINSKVMGNLCHYCLVFTTVPCGTNLWIWSTEAWKWNSQIISKWFHWVARLDLKVKLLARSNISNVHSIVISSHLGFKSNVTKRKLSREF